MWISSILAPCFPAAWKSFKIHYRYRETFYHITLNGEGVASTVHRIVMDGAEYPEKYLVLVDDRIDHTVLVDLT